MYYWIRNFLAVLTCPISLMLYQAYEAHRERKGTDWAGFGPVALNLTAFAIFIGEYHLYLKGGWLIYPLLGAHMVFGAIFWMVAILIPLAREPGW